MFSKALLVAILILVTEARTAVAGSDELVPATAEIRHSDLSVYRADDGTLKPIRSTEDWLRRRKQVIAGAEAAMGSMPTLENLPSFDVKLTEDVRIGEVRRLTRSEERRVGKECA